MLEQRTDSNQPIPNRLQDSRTGGSPVPIRQTSHLSRFLFLHVVLFLFVISASWAEPTSTASIQVKASLDRVKILVGEPIAYQLQMTWRPPISVTTPALKDKLGAFQVLSTENPVEQKNTDGSITRTVKSKLTSFELGAQQIPPVSISYMDPSGKLNSTETTPQKVEVTSYLQQLQTGEKTPLRGIKPPMELPMERWLVWTIAGASVAGLIILALLIWYWRRASARKAKEIPTIPLLPPDEEALRALAEVELDDMAGRESPKVYYSRLSDILRRYLSRQFGFDAMEMTSSELLEQTTKYAETRSIQDQLQEDLNESDSVKFAQYAPIRPKRVAALERIRAIVVATRPAPLTTEESSKQEGAA